MELTIQKMSGYKVGGTQNMLLWRHKDKSVEISYINNDLSYRVGV